MESVYIGEWGTKGGSATVYYNYSEVQDIISHNNNSFWCTEEMTDTRIYIKKETEQGMLLKDMLNDKKPIEDIQDFLLNIVLKHMSVSDFRNVLESNNFNSFTEGIRHNQMKVRQALGL